ncbi:MAG: hypothetical protein U0T02_06320 [Solirubrobacteraceae bacterium]
MSRSARGAAAAAAGLALAALAVFLLAPTYPNYDAYYHLLWGRELLHGHLPSFDAYAAPTEHPLYVAIGALASLAGGAGDRVLVLWTLLALGVVAWGLVRLSAATLRSAWPGVAAAAFLAASFTVLLYALRAYVDVWFLALAIWAGVLVAERRTRPVAVMGLLVAAGLLRPEAWLLAAAYAAWSWREASRSERAWLAAGVVAAPVIWMAVDLAVTGDALFSLAATRTLAIEPQRDTGLGAARVALTTLFGGAARAPVAIAGLLGLALAWRRLGARPLVVPLAFLGAGLLAVAGLGVLDLSVLPRYLLLPAVALSLFAGYALLGFMDLAPGSPARRWWAGLAVIAVIAGAAGLIARGPAGKLPREVRLDRDAHAALVALLDAPPVAAARRCGPVTFPTFRLVPMARWHLDAGQRAVRARPAGPPLAGGVAVTVFGDVDGGLPYRRYALTGSALPSDNTPPRGFASVGRTRFFEAFTRCR